MLQPAFASWASSVLFVSRFESIRGTEQTADSLHEDSYTLMAIGQDDFSDVPMPDAPVQTGAIVGSTPSKK